VIPRGPFLKVKDLHDGLNSGIFYMIKGRYLEPDEVDPLAMYRAYLPDSNPIVFTHGDLHPLNIIVNIDNKDEPQVVSIVDWHQSGWLPAYWEYSKAAITNSYKSEWVRTYLPKIFGPEWIDLEAESGWAFYMNCMGC
jgi:hypothetical protein